MMYSGRRYLTKSIAYAALMVSAFASTVHAADASSGAASGLSPESEAAKSLEDILKKAGEKGLLKLEDPKAPETLTVAPAAANESAIAALDPEGRVEVDCSASVVFDFEDYFGIDRFDQVLHTTANLTEYETAEDLRPLSMQYLSLGLGIEVQAKMKSIDEPLANVLSAMGGVVDGLATLEDIQLIRSYETCSANSEFWTRVAEASIEYGASVNPEWTLSREQVESISDLPPHLASILAVRVGIYAAETEQLTLANTLLETVEPQSRFGLLPQDKSHEMLYFFAMVQKLKGDKKYKQIFEHLGQVDGVYRAPSLLKLVKNDEKDEAVFSDLLSVQQQYKGSSFARKASLELVKHQSGDGEYNYAIDMAKAEFLESHSEFQAAVDVIGDDLSVDLQVDDVTKNVMALDGFFHDPKFFTKYHNIKDLFFLVHKGAVDLNLPDLLESIPADLVADEHKPDTISTERKLAAAQTLYKRGDYAGAIEMSLLNAQDERFRDVLLKASIQQASNTSVTPLVEKSLPEGAEKFSYQIDIAGKNNDWKKAKSALKSLVALDDKNDSAKLNLAIIEYVAPDAASENTSGSIKSLADVVDFEENLGDDIRLVKAFLTNG